MRQAPDALNGGLLFFHGVINLIGIRLHRAMKPHQPLTWHLLPPAAGKLQDHVASGQGEKPQVALGGFAPHLRIEHFDWSFIDLQIPDRFHLRPHGLVDRAQPAGDMLNPLHHLLPGNLDGMAFLEDPFQRVEGKVIVITRQDDVDG